MDKHQTWTAAALAAGSMCAAGLAADRKLGAHGVLGVAAGALAGAYLAGTFVPQSPVFGRSPRRGGAADAFALTFDDGPDPRHTLDISRTLVERGQRATFFVLARAVREHPELVASLARHGHEIASHGDDHGLLAFASPRELDRQLTACEDAVRGVLGRPPSRLFRPPHGVRSPWLVPTLRRRGYTVCGWDGSVFDTASPGVEAIVGRVERLLRPGAIVLLHDGDGSGGGASRRQTVQALPAILDRAARRGLRSVTLSEIVASAA